jgi:hypothetical protein
MTADSVLARIDGALTDYGYIDREGGAMRWRPEPPEEPEDDGPSSGDRPGFTVAAHYRTRQGFNACIRVTVYSEAARVAAERKMAKARHPYPGWSRRPASRCSDCNPKGNPEPLAVDGRAYQRRIKSRRKRR